MCYVTVLSAATSEFHLYVHLLPSVKDAQWFPFAARTVVILDAHAKVGETEASVMGGHQRPRAQEPTPGISLPGGT